MDFFSPSFNQLKPPITQVSAELLQKIKSSYIHFLKDGVEKFIIVSVPLRQKDNTGYCLMLEKTKIEFRRKTQISTTTISLDLDTGSIQSNVSFKETFSFFSKIITQALRDVSENKAQLYAAQK